MKGEKIEHL